jgi:hypothetical protein
MDKAEKNGEKLIKRVREKGMKMLKGRNWK